MYILASRWARIDQQHSSLDISKYVSHSVVVTDQDENYYNTLELVRISSESYAYLCLCGVQLGFFQCRTLKDIYTQTEITCVAKAKGYTL